MKLYERITAENWYKGGSANSDWSRLCVMAHAAQLYGNGACRGIIDRLNEAARAVFRERTRSDALQPCALMNDHPDTTLEDILRLCKFADV